MATKKVSTKTQKKLWVQLVAPGIFNQQVIGETCTYEPSTVMGKHIVVNLTSLTRDMKKQNINVRFKVEEIKGDRAHTTIIGYEMVASSIRRLIRRGRDRIDESFSVVTKDNSALRLKLLLLTKNTTKRSIRSKIRAEANKILISSCRKIDYETFVKDLLSNRVQRELKAQLSKTYPLKICEIRIMQLVGKQGKATEDIPAEEPANTEDSKSEEEESTETVEKEA